MACHRLASFRALLAEEQRTARPEATAEDGSRNPVNHAGARLRIDQTAPGREAAGSALDVNSDE